MVQVKGSGGSGSQSRLDVDPVELIAALNDPERAAALMKSKGWTKKDLIARAELLTKELAAASAAVNMV